jgi:hypothetical protein
MYFPGNLYRYLNTLRGFSEYAERTWRICREKFLLSAMPDEVKGKVIRENLTGDLKLIYGEQITNLIF